MGTKLVIVGGGPAGLLTAYTLAKRIDKTTDKPKYTSITLVERFPDLRTVEASELQTRGDYSLVLSHRGLKALQRVGLKDELCEQGILYRRLRNCIGHDDITKGMVSNAPLDKLAMSRFAVAQALLVALVRDFGDRVTFHFSFALVEIDFNSKLALFVPDLNRRTPLSICSQAPSNVLKISFDVLIGADGAHSRVVENLRHQVHGIAFNQSFAAEPFVSASIPFHEFDNLGLKIDRNSMFSVQSPKRNASLVIIPYSEGLNISLVPSCYLSKANSCPPGSSPENNCFHTINDPVGFEEYLVTSFPLLGGIIYKYLEPIVFPSGKKCMPKLFYTKSEASQYHHPNCAVVALGDAVHAMPPYIGQGINAAFEDVEALDILLDQQDDNWETVPALFTKERQPQGEAALELNEKYVRKNFTFEFALRLSLDIFRNLLNRRFSFIEPSVISLLSHSSTPYTEVIKIRRRHFIVGCTSLGAGLSLIGTIIAAGIYKLTK